MAKPEGDQDPIEIDLNDNEDGEGRSPLAVAVEKLRKTSVDAAASRERLPQPLFWSLFNSKLKEIKEDKEKTRKLKDIFGE